MKTDGKTPTQQGRYRDERSYWAHIRDDLGANLTHFAGALWGMGLKFEPTVKPVWWKAGLSVVLWAGLWLWAVLAWKTGVLIGLCFFWLSPLWAQAVARLGDPVLEYRSYLAVAGWGVILAELLPPWALTFLCARWLLQSWNRSRFLKDNLTYWGQAVTENPALPEKRSHNYGLCLHFESQKSAAGFNVDFEELSLQEFNRVLTVYPDCQRAEFYRTSLLIGRQHREVVSQGGVLRRFQWEDRLGQGPKGLSSGTDNKGRREPNELLHAIEPRPQTAALQDTVSR